MDDVDLVLIDVASGDPFDFYPERYLEQLVAGYSKNTRSGGLEVFMPDYDEVRVDLRPGPRRDGEGSSGGHVPRGLLSDSLPILWTAR